MSRHPDRYDLYLDATSWGQTGWLWKDNEERRYIDALLIKTQQFVQHGGQFDASIQVTIPNEWKKIAPINIGYTAGIESNVVSPAWVDKSSIVDRIIVVSNHAKNGFDQAKYEVRNGQTNEVMGQTSCNTPIDVVHYPVRKFENANIDLNFETDFNFLVVAQNGPRKNVKNTIKWFVEKFKDNSNVGLVLKIFKHGNCTMDYYYMETFLKTTLQGFEDYKCKVYLLHGDMTDEEMTSLYQHKKIKAFVTLTHGEGYGLPLFEAAYNGLPIIAPDWSGHVDFLHMTTRDKKKKRKSAMFAKVDYELKPVQKEAVWKDVIEEFTEWCYPKKDSYKMALSDVYNSYEKHKSKAQKLKKYILENFKENNICEQFVESVEACFDPEESTEQEETVVIL